MPQLTLIDILAITDVSLQLLPFLSLKNLFVLRCACLNLRNSIDLLVSNHFIIYVLLSEISTPPIRFLI